MATPVFTGSVGVGTAIVNGALTEPTDPTYTRQPISMIAAGSGSANADFATFYPQLAAWGVLTSAAVYDTTGTLVWIGPIALPVFGDVAQQLCLLPLSFTASNPSAPFATGSVVVAPLIAWATNPNRTISIDPPGVEVTSGAEFISPLLVRESSGTVDDTIDVSGRISPGDFVVAASMAASSTDITENWCSFQFGSLVTARSLGGVPGGTYQRTLTFSTASGAINVVPFLQSVVGLTTASFIQSVVEVEVMGLLHTGMAPMVASGTDAPSAPQLTQEYSFIGSGENGVRMPAYGSVDTSVSPPATNVAVCRVVNMTMVTLQFYPPTGLGWSGGMVNVPVPFGPGQTLTGVAFPNGTCYILGS